jgi:hypothetical protein
MLLDDIIQEVAEACQALENEVLLFGTGDGLRHLEIHHP